MALSVKSSLQASKGGICKPTGDVTMTPSFSGEATYGHIQYAVCLGLSLYRISLPTVYFSMIKSPTLLLMQHKETARVFHWRWLQ